MIHRMLQRECDASDERAPELPMQRMRPFWRALRDGLRPAALNHQGGTQYVTQEQPLGACQFNI